MLDRHLSSMYRTLQTGNVTENKHHHNSKQHTRKQQPVLRLTVEQWWLLEDAQPTRARREEIEKLHDDERDEVDATCDIDLLGNVGGVVLGIVLAELQPHGRKRDALCFEVPEGHDEGEKALYEADEEVCVKN